MYQESQQKQRIERGFSDLVLVDFAASEINEVLTRYRLEVLEAASVKPHPNGGIRKNAEPGWWGISGVF